jgi:hypothetical protein
MAFDPPQRVPHPPLSLFLAPAKLGQRMLSVIRIKGRILAVARWVVAGCVVHSSGVRLLNVFGHATPAADGFSEAS